MGIPAAPDMTAVGFFFSSDTLTATSAKIFCIFIDLN